MDFDSLERALVGGPTLLLLCATAILGGMVVPFLLAMWVRSEKSSKAEVRELLTDQVAREGQLMEALVTAREMVRSARASVDTNTRVLQAIMGSGSDVGLSGVHPPIAMSPPPSDPESDDEA